MPTRFSIAEKIAEIVAFRHSALSPQAELQILIRELPPTTSPQWSPKSEAELVRLARQRVIDERPPADELADARSVAAADTATLAEFDRVVTAAGENVRGALFAVSRWSHNAMLSPPTTPADFAVWVRRQVPTKRLWENALCRQGNTPDVETEAELSHAFEIADAAEAAGVLGVIRPEKISYAGLRRYADELRAAALRLAAVERPQTSAVEATAVENVTANQAASAATLRPVTVGPIRKPAKRKKRRAVAPRPLTAKETLAMKLWGEHGGKVGQVAQIMKVTHPVVSRMLRNARQKLGIKQLIPARKTHSLPLDSRGNATIVRLRP